MLTASDALSSSPLQAERVDTLLHTLCLQLEPARHHLVCFTTWILYHVLRVMIQYLLSGFELELYSVHEYHYIYWSVVYRAQWNAWEGRDTGRWHALTSCGILSLSAWWAGRKICHF